VQKLIMENSQLRHSMGMPPAALPPGILQGPSPVATVLPGATIAPAAAPAEPFQAYAAAAVPRVAEPRGRMKVQLCERPERASSSASSRGGGGGGRGRGRAQQQQQQQQEQQQQQLLCGQWLGEGGLPPRDAAFSSAALAEQLGHDAGALAGALSMTPLLNEVSTPQIDALLSTPNLRMLSSVLDGMQPSELQACYRSGETPSASTGAAAVAGSSAAGGDGAAAALNTTGAARRRAGPSPLLTPSPTLGGRAESGRPPRGRGGVAPACTPAGHGSWGLSATWESRRVHGGPQFATLRPDRPGSGHPPRSSVPGSDGGGVRGPTASLPEAPRRGAAPWSRGACRSAPHSPHHLAHLRETHARRCACGCGCAGLHSHHSAH